MGKYYIYFIACGYSASETNNPQFYKVGIAKDYCKRLKQLQTGNPAKLSIVGLIVSESKAEAYKKEQKALSLNRFRSEYGEWVRVSKHRDPAITPHQVVSAFCKLLGEWEYLLPTGEMVACDYAEHMTERREDGRLTRSQRKFIRRMDKLTDERYFMA